MSKKLKNVQSFVNKVENISKDEDAREGSYSFAIKNLIEQMGENVSVLNHPGMIEGVFPDFRVNRNRSVIGFVEQKDIGVKLHKFSGKNTIQQRKYIEKFPNLVYTNCLDWDFYSNGELTNSVKIGKLDSNNSIIVNSDEFSTLIRELGKFVNEEAITITDSSKLALHMAEIAKAIRKNILEALSRSRSSKTTIKKVYESCEEVFSKNFSEKEFAEMYSETATFGLLMARLQVKDPDQLSRLTAAALIPSNNEFLRNLMLKFLTDGLGERKVKEIIDEMVEIFKMCDMDQIMERFNSPDGWQDADDPFIDFYEKFSKEFTPEKKVERGVWYTPQPVVRFITRAIDDLLIKEFNLPNGIANESKLKSSSMNSDDKIHRVQILDPAVGTGTFLADTINLIISKGMGKNTKFRSERLEHEILPRMHGFEILMVPYILCQIRLRMTLRNLNCEPSTDQPPNPNYLTNSLELSNKGTAISSGDWFAKITKSTKKMKGKLPILCVIGNPPYNTKDGVAEGKLGDLMKDYKLEPGQETKLDERNPKSINNSYVKFIRTASHVFEENEEGILGFVTDHGFLENLVFRGMRWHLLSTFDKIWVLDLHGNSNRREITPEGDPDKNVFDIKTGVSIIIAMKSKSGSTGLAKIWHGELWGTREMKYEALLKKRITSKGLFKRIWPRHPNYYFEKLDYEKYDRYNKGFGLSQLFPVYSTGLATGWDNFATDEVKEELADRLKNFIKLDVADSKTHYNLSKGSEKLLLVKQDIGKFDEKKLTKICYRPFENRWIYFTGNSDGIISRPREEVMNNLLGRKNLALISSRQQGCVGYYHVFASNKIVNDCAVSNLSKEACYVFPLYTLEGNGGKRKHLNMESSIREKIERLAAGKKSDKPTELEIFDYIYGVLHCHDYRKANARFLRKNFPIIPYPTSSVKFWDISKKGAKLRELHVLQQVNIDDNTYELSDGNNKISNVSYDPKERRIMINEEQYFENVPKEIWNFRIGGYNLAEKWLKDRTNRSLSRQSSREFRKILKILYETIQIMKSIRMKIKD